MPVAKEVFPGVYSIDGRLATRNLVKGRSVYGENLVTVDKTEYRMWTPYRSKLAAAVMNKLRTFAFKEGSSVLYLGASNGTTPSHVSDIIGKKGRLFGVEISERSMRDFVALCEKRENMLPLLADARRIESYSGVVGKGSCDIIYQDVSAKEQAEILEKNAVFLKKGGYAYLAIKSQSIDISREPKEVYKEVLHYLENTFEILEQLSLEPYDSAHLFAVLRKR